MWFKKDDSIWDPTLPAAVPLSSSSGFHLNFMWLLHSSQHGLSSQGGGARWEGHLRSHTKHFCIPGTRQLHGHAWLQERLEKAVFILDGHV